MVDEFDSLAARPAWLGELRDNWQLQATAEFGYGIVAELDKYLQGPGRLVLVRDAARRVVTRLRSLDDPIAPATLNAIGAGQPESQFERPVPRAALLEPAEDILDLLEFGDDTPAAPRPFSAGELERALALHAAWLEAPLEGQRLVLKDIMATGADFEGANLARAKIRRSDLRGADFSGAKLLRVEMEDTRLTSARFATATFDAAELLRCNCEHAAFGRARLVRSRFIECRMDHAVFEDAVVGVQLRDVSLAHGALRRSELRGTLMGDFRGCDFSNSDLRGVDFRHADLRGANFDGGILDRVGFKDVRVAEVSGTPYWADTLRGSDIDFSPSGDRSEPGSTEALRQRLGAGARTGVWGSAADPSQYQAMRVEGESEPYHSIERRADHAEVVRVSSITRSGETIRVGYQILDPRFGDPIAQHLVREVLFRSPVASEFNQAAQRIQYVNLALPR
jgi:uncharacterized protein YjbI with pentapeptide repeats